MKFVCHRQDCTGVGWNEAACRKCDLKMTVGGVARYVTGFLFSRVQGKFGIGCPECGRLIPVFSSTCKCGATLTVGGVWENATGPQRERLRRMTTPTRANMRRFQWAYLLVSMAAFINGWIWTVERPLKDLQTWLERVSVDIGLVKGKKK